MRNNVLAVAVMLLVPAAALGAAVMSVTVGGASTVVAMPGQTLAVDISLSGLMEGLAGFEMRLRDVGSSGKLSITWRTWGPAFSDCGCPLCDDPRGPLNPRSKNLGCLAMTEWGPELFPALIETVGLKIDPTWNGSTLTVRITDLLLADPYAQPILVSPGPDLTITPEPASLLLLGLGGLFLRRRRGLPRS